MPSIINQKENMYKGIVIEIWSDTTTQRGRFFQKGIEQGEEDIEVSKRGTIGEAGVC
jgi:hypothetical protein